MKEDPLTCVHTGGEREEEPLAGIREDERGGGGDRLAEVGEAE